MSELKIRANNEWIDPCKKEVYFRHLATGQWVKVKHGDHIRLDNEWVPIECIPETEDAYIFTLSIPSNGISITLPTVSDGTYNYTVDWGDGTIQTITTWDSIDRTHVYLNSGLYEVKITGKYSKQNASSFIPFRTYIINVISFGKVGWESLDRAFMNCSNLKYIGPNITFEGESMDRTFLSSGLEEIPPYLFNGCPNLKTLSYVFGNTKITTIPWQLLASLNDLTSITGLFTGCSSLTIIPENLFESNLILSDISWAFSGTGILEIPEKLFKNNYSILIADGVFAGGQFSSIPPRLFETFINTYSFYELFAVGKIETIPYDLFETCLEALDFRGAFRNNLLETIPLTLFDNCNKVTNFRQTFANNSNVTGDAIPLWQRSTLNLIGTACYLNCVQLSNYNAIPNNWK